MGCCYSVTQSCSTLCNPMDCSRRGFLVLHHLPELAQTHVHWVRDAIQPPSPLTSPLLLPSIFLSSAHFSHSVMSGFLYPNGLQHARPSLSITRVHSNSCPSNHLILCSPLLLPPSIFPSIRVFSNESALCIRWPKYWSFKGSVSVLTMNIQG